MKQIPVFIISGKSPLGDPGGYPAYSHSLSQILNSLDYKVNTLAIGKKEEVKETEYGSIIIITTRLLKIFPFLEHLALAGLPYYSVIFARRIKKIAQKEKIDQFIIWGMGPWGFAGVVLKLILPKNIKMTFITSYFTSTRHEMKGALDAIKIKDYGILPKLRYFIVYEFVARIYNVFEKITVGLSDSVVLHYNSSKKIVKQYFNVPDKKIELFPWHTEIFKRQGIQDVAIKKYKHPLIVSICRQDPRKGINFIIHAIKIASKKFPEIQCLIVGSGSFLTLNKKLVEKLKLKKNINVVGFAPDIKPILQEADIAVIVPLAQGSSALTVLEAMSFGKAVIGSNCDGIPEDIIHNKSGLIIKKGNEHELADAITQLIEDKQLRKKLGENAKKASQQKFGFNKMKNEIETLLNKYVHQK
ncbi:MAG: glycosyltransferase family 4 protein [Candidatus Levybacteria bacterium]|nr:glycosyltransferase family 4 protein [Candidatus Levybacteria bacterium]